MATYVVGDIQGCFNALRCVLDHAGFDRRQDRLWCTGDLVNRGTQSLATLRFIRDLGDSALTILGNHDLHLLAVYYGAREVRKSDTLHDVLEAPDAAELCSWLRQAPLLLHDEQRRLLLVHAGIPHIWDRRTTLACAKDLEMALRGGDYINFLSTMYGDRPAVWSEDLRGADRLRIITNYFTRMRLIDPQGRLELKHKGGLESKLPTGYMPWFRMRHPDWQGYSLLFGHWAALQGETGIPGARALDTGCVWGQRLTLLRLEGDVQLSCDCGTLVAASPRACSAPIT